MLFQMDLSNSEFAPLYLILDFPYLLNTKEGSYRWTFVSTHWLKNSFEDEVNKRKQNPICFLTMFTKINKKCNKTKRSFLSDRKYTYKYIHPLTKQIGHTKKNLQEPSISFFSKYSIKIILILLFDIFDIYLWKILFFYKKCRLIVKLIPTKKSDFSEHQGQK